jgi:hypothetical protein
MTQKGIHLRLSNIFRMKSAFIELDEPDNPVTIGLLRAISVMVMSENQPDLLHQAQIVIRPQLFLAIRLVPPYPEITESRDVLFPYLTA